MQVFKYIIHYLTDMIYTNLESSDNPSKRRDDSFNIDLILKKERIDNDDFNVIVLHASPEQRLDFIIRQLSFYLSPDNLSIDHFYHSKFKEDSANIGVENVMDVKYILSAKRMMEIKATIEDIKKVISENLIPNLSFHDFEGTLYIKLNDPLPKYVGKKPIIKKKFGETPETFHVAGPIVKITNIPLDVKEWTLVKQAINNTNKAKVKFISSISEGSCYAWLSKTSNLSDLMAEKPLVNGSPINIELINDESEFKKLESVRNFVVRNFGSIKTLLNNLLNEVEVGTQLSLESEPGQLVRNFNIITLQLTYILEYHPNSKEKKGGNSRTLFGYEVGTNGSRDGKNKKCFKVVTKSLEGENLAHEVLLYNLIFLKDLSITKCLEGLKLVIHTFNRPERTDFIKSLSV
uniref:La domain containing protein, putative n=1 Tax=Theileria annulata TaxID=5874 RepID=A0A3B0MMM6_THEAN